MNRIKRRIFNYLLLIIIYIKKIVYKNYVFVLGTPLHGNIGDQAIIYSEIEMFKKELNVKVIEVDSFLVHVKFKTIKKIVKDSPIFIHGGGFLGTLWPEEEEMFRTILKEFPNNKIIVLPQTCYFEENMDYFLKESISIYSSHKNLTFYLRERYSYEYMKKNFPKCDIRLVPDIVLYNKIFDFENDRHNILFCLRSDKEKKFNSFDDVINMLTKEKYIIDYTDTIIHKKVFPFNRKKVILKKLKQFSKYKLVITDRLHGMVFAYLTKTPCLVFENKSYKVRGLYEWISKCNYVKLYDESTLIEDLEYLLNIKETKCVELKDNFKELITNCLNGAKDEKF